MALWNGFLIFLLTVIGGVHATLVPEPEKPTNISCIWHGKRNLVCEVQVVDIISSNQYNCSVCPYFSGSSPPNETCPVGYEDSDCPASTGRCLYDCVEHGYCRESHMIKITVSRNRSIEPTSWCRLIDTRKHLKPGPVRDLTLTFNASTKVKVKWKKPDDRHNDEDGYRYIVYCPYNKTHVKKGKREDKFAYCGRLKPGQNYIISVKAQAIGGGYWSDLQNASIITPEDVPTSGPFVPDGAFSVVDKDQLVFYWGMVPEGKRRGQIQNYSIIVNSCLNTTVSNNTYFTTAIISRCGPGPLNVLTYASTRIGRSKKPFIRKLNYHLFDNYRVQSVHRSNHSLEWVYPVDKAVESFNVYWCYGNQDKNNPQLVECRRSLNWTTQPGSRRNMTLESMDVPSLPCSLCSWQYAVSVNINNTSAGMVWNTPHPTESTNPAASVTSEDDTMKSVVIVTLVLVAALCFAVICGIIIVLYKKQLICERIIIIVPKLQSTDTSNVEDTSFSKPTHKCTPAKLYNIMKPLLRDTGDVSMNSSRQHGDSSRRGLHCTPGVVELTKEDEYENMFSLNKASAHKVSANQDRGLLHSEPLVEDDVWASPDTSAMSDYRQVACSEIAEPQGEEGVTISSETTTDNNHRICSSEPVGFPFSLHVTASIHSLPKGSSPTHQSAHPGISTDPQHLQRSEPPFNQKLVCKSGTATDVELGRQIRKEGCDVSLLNVDSDVKGSGKSSSHLRKPVTSQSLWRYEDGCSKPRLTSVGSSCSDDKSLRASIGSYSAVVCERT